MSIDFSKADVWRELQERHSRKPSHDGTTPGDGGGDGNKPNGSLGMKDYVDAKIETLEHKLFGRLDQLSTKATIWGAVATAIAVLLAVLAFGGGRFDAGMSLANQKVEQMKRDDRQDSEVRDINAKLDKILQQQARKY